MEGIKLLAILAAIAKLIFGLFELVSADVPGLEWLLPQCCLGELLSIVAVRRIGSGIVL